MTFFNDMIPDMISNIKRNQIMTELFIEGRILIFFTVFFIKTCFAVTKDVSLNCTCFFIMNIRNRWELQENALNHWSDIDFEDLYIFTKIVPQHYILVNDTTLTSDNLLCLKKNFQKEYKKLIAKMS